MKYEIPQEPPIGSKVITPRGFVYERKTHTNISGKNWESNGTPCSWDRLCAIGVDDYVEPQKGEAYYRVPDDDFFGELKIYDGTTWHHFTYGYKDGRIETYDLIHNYDKREWKKA